MVYLRLLIVIQLVHFCSVRLFLRLLFVPVQDLVLSWLESGELVLWCFEVLSLPVIQHLSFQLLSVAFLLFFFSLKKLVLFLPFLCDLHHWDFGPVVKDLMLWCLKRRRNGWYLKGWCIPWWRRVLGVVIFVYLLIILRLLHPHQELVSWGNSGNYDCRLGFRLGLIFFVMFLLQFH